MRHTLRMLVVGGCLLGLNFVIGPVGAMAVVLLVFSIVETEREGP